MNFRVIVDRSPWSIRFIRGLLASAFGTMETDTNKLRLMHI